MGVGTVLSAEAGALGGVIAPVLWQLTVLCGLQTLQ